MNICRIVRSTTLCTSALPRRGAHRPSCLSNLFYTTPRTEIRGTEFDALTGTEAFPKGSELIWNESQAWIHIGRFLWWQPEIEQIATDALHVLLDVPAGRPLPPLITVHIRCVGPVSEPA